MKYIKEYKIGKTKYQFDYDMINFQYNTFKKMKDNVLHKVAKIIADRYDVEPEYIFQNTRKRKITDIRAIFHYMSNRYTNQRLQRIGEFSQLMGRQQPHNHASVIYGCRKVKSLYATDKKFKEDVDKYVSKKSSLTISNIIDRIFYEDNYEYLDALDMLMSLLYEHKDITDIFTLIEKQKATNERVHQATSDDSGLGVV